ncbi:unnamed protein product [Urochloa humidicola]
MPFAPQLFAAMSSHRGVHQQCRNNADQVFDELLDQILTNQHTLARQIEITGQVVAQLTLKQMNIQREETSSPTSSNPAMYDVHVEVIWDDEFEQDQSSHGGLLQLLAGGGEYPDEELMESGQGNYLLQQDIVVPDAPWMFVGMSQGSVHSVISEMGHTVTWDEDLQQVLDEYGSLTQPAHGEEGLEAVCSVFDGRPQLDVIWDEEMQSDTHMHDSLLQQLAAGQECCDSVQMAYLRDVIWDDDDLYSDLDTQHGSVQQSAYLVCEGSKLIAESVIDDVLTQDNCSSFILDAGIDVSDAEKRLELKVIDDDKLLNQMECGDSENIKWDVMPADSSLNDVLWKHLDDDREKKKSMGELEADAISILVNSSPKLLESHMDTTYQVSANLVDGVAEIGEQLGGSSSYGKAQTDKMEVNLTDNGHMRPELGTPDYQLCKMTLQVTGPVSYLPWVLQFDIATALDDAEMSAGKEMNHSTETFAISDEKQEVTDLRIVFAESQPWMKLHTCKMQEAQENPNLNKYSLYKVVASSRRQWDPGITCYDAVWKQLMNTATAWGQAVFHEGGNVMTHRRPRRSPKRSGPGEAQVAAQVQEKSIQERNNNTGRGSIKFRNQKQRKEPEVVFLLPLYRDLISLDFLWIAYAPGVDLTGEPWAITGMQLQDRTHPPIIIGAKMWESKRGIRSWRSQKKWAGKQELKSRDSDFCR